MQSYNRIIQGSDNIVEGSLGLVHIYCGDGKGKTSSAVGLAVRASGYGYKVLMMQFLKSGRSSEMKILEGLDSVTVFDGYCVNKFVGSMTEKEKMQCRENQNDVFAEAVDKVKREKYNVLVLDEVFGAMNTDTLDKSMVLDFIKNKPEDLEVVMTGREPSAEFFEFADYITEMKKIKHPYDAGVNARSGIER